MSPVIDTPICPYCGKAIEITREMLAVDISCPHCGGRLVCDYDEREDDQEGFIESVILHRKDQL